MDWPQGKLRDSNGSGDGVGSSAKVPLENLPPVSCEESAEVETVTASNPADRAIQAARPASPAEPAASRTGVLRARPEVRSTLSSPRLNLMFRPQALVLRNVSGRLAGLLRLSLGNLSAIVTPGFGYRRCRECVENLANGLLHQKEQNYEIHSSR